MAGRMSRKPAELPNSWVCVTGAARSSRDAGVPLRKGYLGHAHRKRFGDRHLVLGTLAGRPIRFGRGRAHHKAASRHQGLRRQSDRLPPDITDRDRDAARPQRATCGPLTSAAPHPRQAATGRGEFTPESCRHRGRLWHRSNPRRTTRSRRSDFFLTHHMVSEPKVSAKEASALTEATCAARRNAPCALPD
jgi:hypothetical protein